MISEVLRDDFYSFEEMAVILRRKPSTLKQQIYCGRNHPPYKVIIGETVFPKSEFRTWALTHKTIYEVRSAS